MKDTSPSNLIDLLKLGNFQSTRIIKPKVKFQKLKMSCNIRTFELENPLLLLLSKFISFNSITSKFVSHMRHIFIVEPLKL